MRKKRIRKLTGKCEICGEYVKAQDGGSHGDKIYCNEHWLSVKSPNIGGVRPNAGRDPVLKKPINKLFTLDRCDVKALRGAANRDNISMSEIIRTLIRQHITEDN